MELFQLKKVRRSDQCQAMRCTNTPDEAVVTASVELWGLPPGTVQLCQKHHAMAESYAAQSDRQSVMFGEPGASIVRDSEGAKLIGFSEVKGGASAWLSRVYDVVQELEVLAEDGRQVVEIVKGLSVDGQDDLEQVSTWAQDVKAQVKTVLGLEKEITTPLATALARIRELCKPVKTVWADAEHLLRAHLEAAALRQEERNRAAQEEAAELASQGEDPTAALARVTYVSDLSGVSLKIRWKAVVKDVKLMPDEFVIRIPNDKKLKEYCAAAEGEPEPMAGVEFVRDVDSRIQAAKS